MRSLEDKIVDRAEFFRRAAALRKAGGKLVFSNGCFDILHAGHVRYLTRARGFGDALFLGVNSDASVRELKGPTRPLVSQRERSEVLSALEMVDCLTLFDEPTPLALIVGCKPHVLVKGGDYRPETVVGASEVQCWGGRLELVAFEQGLGTSLLIERILERHPACEVEKP